MEEQPKAKRNFELCFENKSLSNISSLILALRKFRSYSNFALSKISRLALVGYFTKGAQSAYRAFFVRIISMHSHVMAKLDRDTLECAGFLLYLSTNPFQLCHPHLVVTGKAPRQTKGAH
ncbi:hypothetical protein [Acinetobacter modestus]|uniref:hypothetical protein n=1 Tax=Acinetobacter modestus TaxID=1776740 RepID=UPI003AFA46C6